jgi:hypothetical protein
LLVSPLKLEEADCETDLTADSALPAPAVQRGILVDPIRTVVQPGVQAPCSPGRRAVPFVHQTRQPVCVIWDSGAVPTSRRYSEDTVSEDLGFEELALGVKVARALATLVQQLDTDHGGAVSRRAERCG